MNNIKVLSIILFLTSSLLLAGCSGGSPIIPPAGPGDVPGLTGDSVVPDQGTGGHLLSGYWHILLNIEEGCLDVIPLRSTEMHLNLAGILCQNPQWLSVQVNDFNIPGRLLDFDITITHPVPNSDIRVFDLRGILMGLGDTLSASSDAGLVYTGLDGIRLLNSDGYTRWWNAVEFTTPGIFGYDNDFIVPDFLIPTTTLNPYKYFADALDSTDEVIPNVNDTNRGTFSTTGTPPSITRNYLVRFPLEADKPKLGFHFAIDLSFAPATGGNPTPKPVDDFPIAANMPEAFYIDVNMDNSWVWYMDDENRGGDLVLDIEVFDWGAMENPDGINGEIESITLESQTLFPDPVTVQSGPMTGTQSTSGVFHITIPNCTPTDVMDQEILVTVKSSYPATYAPPVPGPDWPQNAHLAAYTLVEVPILVAEPSFVEITLESPNGGEYWVEANMYEISWEAHPEIENVIILLSNDSGQEYTTPVALTTPNDGSFLWYIDPSIEESNHCRLKVTDVLPTEISDESDEDFVIFNEELAPIKVLYPNGGEIWKAQLIEEVIWEANPDIANVRIELTLNDGADYPVLVIESTPNTGSFIWDPIPDIAVGENCRIKITNVDDATVYDVSNAIFSIKPMGDSYIDLQQPLDGAELIIGGSEQVEWVWDGTISAVDILFKLDGEDTYTALAEGVANTGWEIIEFEPEGINDLTNWDSLELTGTVRVEDSDDPGVFDEVPVTVPINLGILYDMVQASSDGDADDDSIPDDVEDFLGTDPDDRDCDINEPDARFDNYEIFGQGYFDPYDLIPDEDQDNVIAPLDNDDNNDGVNDGEMTDTDLDGIPNYLEHYGYTYDWMSGTFEKWDGESTDVPYFKTDPLQPSTDQDPYSDSMEVSGAFMDVSVRKPGDYPMVPAYPNILIRLEGYDVILNQEITFEQGESLEQGTEWSAETSREHGTELEHNWEVGVEVGIEISKEPKITGSVHANYGGHHTNTNSVGYTVSQGGSLVESTSWSRATSVSTTDAAHVRLYLKAYNYGTSCASNISPTITLKIGNRNISTFMPQGTVINILEPGGIYPAVANTYWVVDTTEAGPISLSLDDLRAIECGAPLSIVITQMNAEVMLMNDSGQWESAGEWGEYMARCEAVCSNMYLELDGGRFLHYLVYSDDSYLAPEVTFGDALIWIAGAEADSSDTWITYYDQFGIEQHQSLAGWDFAFDPQTLLANGLGIDPITLPDPDYNLADLVLNPDSIIVGKMPREDLDDPFIGTQIAFAYLDEELDIVRALVFDYNGVDTVTYKDRYDNYIEIEEFIEGSGIYEYTIPSDYVFFGTEAIIATGINPPADPEDAQSIRFVEKVVYPEIITTIPPDIRNVELDIVNKYLYCQIVSDPGYPVTSAKAYHPMFTAEKNLTKTPLWMGDPYGYYLEGFTGVTVDNYDDLILEAVVTGGGYDAYKLNDSNLLNNNYKGHGSLYAYCKDMYGQAIWNCHKGITYVVEQINLDVENFQPVRQTFQKDAPALQSADDYGYRIWMSEFQTDMEKHSWDIFIRLYDPNDDSQKWGTSQSWLFWSNREYAIYSGTNSFNDITKAECEAQIFNPPGGGIPLSTWEDGTPIATMPLILIIKTDAGRFSKLLLSTVNVVDLSDFWLVYWMYRQSSVYVNYDYVTFKSDQESSVWNESTTSLSAEVNYEPIAPGSTVMVEGLKYSTFDIDTAARLVIDEDEFWTQAMTPASNIDIWFRYYSGDGTWPSPGPDVEQLGPTPGWILFSHSNFDVEYEDVDMSELTRLDVTARSFPYENYFFMPDGNSSATNQDWMVYLKSDEERWTAINIHSLTSGLTYDTESCLHTAQLDLKFKIFKAPGD